MQLSPLFMPGLSGTVALLYTVAAFAVCSGRRIGPNLVSDPGAEKPGQITWVFAELGIDCGEACQVVEGTCDVDELKNLDTLDELNDVLAELAPVTACSARRRNTNNWKRSYSPAMHGAREWCMYKPQTNPTMMRRYPRKCSAKGKAFRRFCPCRGDGPLTPPPPRPTEQPPAPVEGCGEGWNYVDARDVEEYLSYVAAAVVDRQELDLATLAYLKKPFSRETEKMGAHARVIKQALDLVESYESTNGPLFLNNQTSGTYRRGRAGKELDDAVKEVHEAVLDHIYNNKIVYASCIKLLGGRPWQTAAFWPGTVNSSGPQAHTVEVVAKNRKRWGGSVMYDNWAALRPTGLYLVPGGIANISVPEAFAGKGYQVQIGSHIWTMGNKKREYPRLARVVTYVDLAAPVTQLTSPLGGGVYILVPYERDDGLLQAEISGAVVRAPFFQSTQLHHTTAEEWAQSRVTPGPWAVFETDKFMLNVPKVWISDFSWEHVDALLKQWDIYMDGTNEYAGFFGEGFSRDKTTLYIGADVRFKASVYSPGYPQSNDRVKTGPSGPKPAGPDGRSTAWYLHSEKLSTNTVAFHELGHGMRLQMFGKGESEVIGNFLLAYILNVKLGHTLDKAFELTFNAKLQQTPDMTAFLWLQKPTFRKGLPMYGGEAAFQHRGIAKYHAYVKLFGWTAWRNSQRVFHTAGMEQAMAARRRCKWRKNRKDSNWRFMQMSKAAGADIRPLMAIWGMFPQKPEDVNSFIAEEGLCLSTKVKMYMENMKTLVPMNQTSFNTTARLVHKNVDKCRDKQCKALRRDMAIWSDVEADATKAQIDKVIADFYTGAQCVLDDVNTPIPSDDDFTPT